MEIEEDSEGFWEGGAPQKWGEPKFLNHHMEGCPITRSTKVKFLNEQEININYISLTSVALSFIIAHSITLDNNPTHSHEMSVLTGD